MTSNPLPLKCRMMLLYLDICIFQRLLSEGVILTQFNGGVNLKDSGSITLFKIYIRLKYGLRSHPRRNL